MRVGCENFWLGKQDNILNMDLTGINFHHGSFPARESDMAQKLCWIQCFSRESGLLGTGSRAGTAHHFFPGDSSQEQTCLSKTARGHCCLSCCYFLEEMLQARKSSVVLSLFPAAVFLCTVCWEKDLGALGRGISGSELQGRQAVLAGSVPALLWGSLLQLGYRDTMALLALQVA